MNSHLFFPFLWVACLLTQVGFKFFILINQNMSQDVSLCIFYFTFAWNSRTLNPHIQLLNHHPKVFFRPFFQKPTHLCGKLSFLSWHPFTSIHSFHSVKIRLFPYPQFIFLCSRCALRTPKDDFNVPITFLAPFPSFPTSLMTLPSIRLFYIFLSSWTIHSSHNFHSLEALLSLILPRVFYFWFL